MADKKIDMNGILREMLDSGKSLEAVMKEISDAANAIEQERSNKATFQKLCDHYMAPLNVEGEQFIKDICKRKMSAHDLAIIRLHFYAQNIPGFIENYLAANAKKNEKALKSMEESIQSQVKLHKRLSEVLSEALNADRKPKRRNVPMDGGFCNKDLNILAGMLSEEIDKMLADCDAEVAQKDPNTKERKRSSDPIVKFFEENDLL